ncbi:MAG: radical SAM family heme chaperone HemW [Muribaculaceae bacterium]|nr:radical SAM family heme chaperone HemW [Muribaculaceae bacterium]
MAGLYVHIPYCHSKCAYCDFYSVANTLSISQFLPAITNEWHKRCSEIDKNDIKTIYFGGGTPSILSPSQFELIASVFPKDKLEEFTIEVNPEDVSADAVRIWRRSGVNRVSMGVQSLVDSELRFIGRRHDATKALDAISILKDGGISNISCDLIYGLPLQTCQSWQYSLEKLLEQNIQHLSAYCLSYEEGTRLYRMLAKGKIAECDDNLISEMYGVLCKVAKAHLMEHYEISNFAMPGMYSRHNSAYWNSTPYLGLGPGAHSMDSNGFRRYVPADVKAYINSLGLTVVEDMEDEIDKLNDIILTGLRTAIGVDLSKFTEAQKERIIILADSYLRKGMVVCDGSTMKITEESWLLSDAIIRDLFFERDC